ncbi:MAG: hypothetical protein JOZ78_00075 [Chroococcidiopsidaceae cyanobacterium CP_BM_ER_R8_30]|nr:hypothetical protein [Chroococcidiopsidaceae cyanobacterium CP_BM_ER_R8_30]
MKKLFLSGLAVLGFGFATIPTVVKAQQSIMAEGYTQSPTPISGKHCYYSGGSHANYYCYNPKLGGSSMQPNFMNSSSSSRQQPNSTDNGSPPKQSSSSNNNGSPRQQPNSTNNSKPPSAVKTPSNSIKPGYVINSPHSLQGGSGGK